MTNTPPDPDKTDADKTDAEQADAEEVQTFSEAFSAAMKQSGFARVNPDEDPTFSGMLSVVGGVRGLIESFLPGLVFLIIFTLTSGLPEEPVNQRLLVSVLPPIGVAILFVIARAVTRKPLMPAISGAIGIAITAAFSLFTNNASNNFLPGILINSGVILALVISLVARWPFVGIVVGFIMGDHPDWRHDALKLRALTIATYVWIIPSAIRLVIQIPLYLSNNVEILAATKLLTGLPLYAGALWLTWILVRRVYSKPVDVSGTPAA